MSRTVAAVATVAGVALSAILGATLALAASPIPGTLGLRLQPAPVHVDEVRTFMVANLSGGLALAVTLTAEPATYQVKPATFTLAVDETREVAITAVDPKEDGRLTARGTATTAGGAVTSAVAVGTRFVHRVPAIPEPVLWGALAILALLLAALAVLWRRRRA